MTLMPADTFLANDIENKEVEDLKSNLKLVKKRCLAKGLSAE